MNAALTASHQDQFVEWAFAARTMPGEEISGDLHLVSSQPGGVLASVVDGLGHGSEALVAARTAVDVLEKHAGESVIALVQRCHAALKETRGAVMTVLAINAADDTVTALGIGNVEATLLRRNPVGSRAREDVLLRGGVVGYQLPALQASVMPIYSGDVIVFATDGIREGFAERVSVTESPRSLVDRIMSEYFRGTDDALVLAIRYLGVTRG